MSKFNAPFRDKNSERYMYEGRIEQIVRYLRQKYLVTDTEMLGDFLFSDGQKPIDKVDEGEWSKFGPEDRWGDKEYYCRFKHSFDVPERFKGKNVFYEILPFDTMEWTSSDTQFIIQVNGELLQGADPNHREIKLLDCANGSERYDICLSAYSDKHVFVGKKVMRAQLKSIDELTWNLIFDLETPLMTAKYFGPDDMERVDIIKALNEAVNLLELDNPDRAVYEASAKKCIAYLDKNLYGKTTVDAVFSCIGHTHIDVAWLWRLRQTREKAGRSFATVLKLMEEYPEYKFMSSQAQLYEYVKKDYPEVYEKIKQAVKDGKWEIEGSMWVEPDTNVPSGESLVRQFLVGKRFFKDEFGIDTKIMWEPDVFGYSAALPQIIKKSGVDYFMTTKISWNEYNRVPYDTFMWRGIDGTEVLSHFSPSRGGDDTGNSFMTTYNAFLSPTDIVGGWNRYSQKDLNNNVLCTFGFGDGGGGPTREMLEYGRRMNKGIPGCPKTVIESSLDFYKNLEKDVVGNKKLPTWVGELYLEFHRATLTSQAANKMYNRKSEVLMHDFETISSLANLELGEEYPREHITEDWKQILLHQFHDILPGSSIEEVYWDSDEVYKNLLSVTGSKLNDTMSKLAANMKTDDNSLVVFNTLGIERNDIVITDMPEFDDFAIVDANGKEMKWQKTFDGKLCFLAEKVPAKGYKVFTIVKGEHKQFNKIYATPKTFRNKYYKVKFDKNMNISSFYHKASGREVAPEGALINRLVAYDDRPFNHEAWDIKAYYSEKSWNIDDVQSAELVECGAVRCVYKIVRKFRSTEFTQLIIGYADNDRIDVIYDFDWQETHVLLKVDNEVDVNTDRATFDIQFGNIERSAHENTLWDFAQFETMGHKWVDLSDNSFGFSLINDSKYGHSVKDGHVRTSLIRASMEPCVDQDKGPQHIETALYAHSGAVCESDVVNQANSLNFPLHCVKAGKNDGKLDSEYSLVNVDKSNVIIETVKIAEDSDEVVIRCYETWNKRTPCTIKLGKDIKSAFVTNLLEENEKELTADGNSLKVTFKPFEIKTIKIKL